MHHNTMNMNTTMNTMNMGGSNGVQLELLPLEFNDIDEARRVNDMQVRASWKAKEKSRARKKAKLENNAGLNTTTAMSNGASAMSGSGTSGSSSLDGKEGSMNVDVSCI